MQRKEEIMFLWGSEMGADGLVQLAGDLERPDAAGTWDGGKRS